MDMEGADVLVDILRCLLPRSLAAARCVCKAWRAVVDDHLLLRADLLPLSLDGIIYETADESDNPRLFARRSIARHITGCLKYLDGRLGVKERGTPTYDCCNGLLLLSLSYYHVVNPATRQWAQLPPPKLTCPQQRYCGHCRCNLYLLYDPTISPHYEVLSIPCTISKHEPNGMMEWPPSSCIIYIFSSKSSCWNGRSFIREGDTVGIAADMTDFAGYSLHSAYWQRTLYVPCFSGGFILRINLSDDRYQQIELPRGYKGLPRLGKSMEGVYCALIQGRCKCEIWFLDETRGQMEWVLRNEINLQLAVTKYSNVHVEDGPWIPQSHDQKERLLKNDGNLILIDANNQAISKDDFKWDSADENTVGTTKWPRESNHNSPDFECFGFHPYKEIVLFCWSDKIIAYHFNSSKVRYLGKMLHTSSEIDVSFAYAPCWMRDLPGST